MKRLKFLILMIFVLAVPAFFWGTADALFTPGMIPDYFGIIPNYANSPTNIQKFLDTLPGLGPTGANNLGQYIPVAVADTTAYPGSDYYEIALVRYTEKMHTNVPAITFSGNTGAWEMEESVKCGAIKCLRKPFGIAHIKDDIAKYKLR